MALDFDKYAQKGNEFVHLVEEDLKVSRDKAGRIVRAVLMALRKRLSLEESFQLIAQLPMALKSVYVDRWNLNQEYKRINTVDEFLDEIRAEDQNRAGYDFGNDAKAKIAVSAVFNALRRFVSEGEMEEVINMLPQPLKEFLKEKKVLM